VVGNPEREGHDKGFFLTCDYSSDALHEGDFFFRLCGRPNIRLAFLEILAGEIARKLAQSGRNKRITAATKTTTSFWPAPFQIARGVAKVKIRIARNSKTRLIFRTVFPTIQTSPDTLKTLN